MKRVNLVFLIPLLLIPVKGRAQYAIPHGIFSSGGAVRSGSHIIYDTAGQTAADTLAGGSYAINLGFWYLAELSSAVDVAIASFTGEYSGEIVSLGWSVSCYPKFDGYDIYRAEGDLENFIRINKERLKATAANYSDITAIPGRSYSYYVSMVEGGCEAVRSATIKLTLPPKPLTLCQNYPNPFNPSTTISFFLPDRADVTLDIFDVKGRRVKTLVNGIKPAGRYKTEWNGKNSRGNSVSSGVYYYRLATGKEIITKKLVLMR